MEYGILSLIPPILTCVLAFATKQTVMSLAVGLFSGALILHGFNIGTAFTESCGTYITGAMMSSGHAATIIFLLVMAGMIALVEASGGLQAIAKTLSRRIKNARAAQVITSILGCIVFFDDFANILIVGPTARPLSDRLGVSREKQTYIVHTTAGVVAGIAVFTTWIGFEIGLISDTFTEMGYEVNGFAMVIRNLPYMLYNILAIVVLFAVAIMMRDFGPMYKAEKKARLRELAEEEKEAMQPADGEEAAGSVREGKLSYAMIPIAVFALTMFFGLWISGYQTLEGGVTFFSIEGFRLCFGEADPMPVCVWASILSTLAALAISKISLKMKMKEIYDIWLNGFTGLCEVCIILVLAWSVGAVINDLGTAQYIISLVGESVPVQILPAIIFIVSCLISFSTGTSWGTMPIMFPIAIPLVASMVDDPTGSPLIIASIAAVLSGCIFGDQTSPISDSSIVTSASVGCDLLAHIKTEAPYEIFPAVLAVVGYLLVGFVNVPIALVIVITVIAAILFVRFVGKSTKPEDLERSGI